MLALILMLPEVICLTCLLVCFGLSIMMCSYSLDRMVELLCGIGLILIIPFAIGLLLLSPIR